MLNHRRRAICVTAGLGAAALISAIGPISGTDPTRMVSQVSAGTAPSRISGTTADLSARPASATVAPDSLSATPGTAIGDLPAEASQVGALPDVAQYAYQRAAVAMSSIKPDCHLGWGVLAAIGQIESDHGRSGGAVLRVDGTSAPRIRGVELNGSGPVSKVRDTDAGELDGDPVWDRAVGPMQFLPSTWRVVGVDADGDGLRSPDDIDDAALAAGVYLCGWGDDLSSAPGLQRSIYRYNRSHAYVSTVLSLARGYDAGQYDVAAAGFLGNLLLSGASLSVPTPDANGYAPSGTPSSGTKGSSADDVGAAPIPSSVVRHEPSGAHHAPAVDAPASPASSDPGTGSAPSPDPSSAPSAGPDPSADPAPQPSPQPSPQPDPQPSPPRSPQPPPRPDGVGPEAFSGTLEVCGSDVFCVDSRQLALGALEAAGTHDYDGDGTLETRREELSGLVGTLVRIEVEQHTEPAVLRTLNGLPW